jgi:hypothetical protein
LVIVSALLLVPAAQAFAGEAHLKLNIVGTGSGEVKSEEVVGIAGPGTPPIDCSYEGVSAKGACENVPSLFDETEGIYAEQMQAVAAAGSELVGWTLQKGEDVNECPSLSFGSKHVCIVYNEVEGQNDEWEITAEFALEPTLTIGASGAGVGTVECEIDGGGLEACPASVAKGSKVKVVAGAGSGSTLGSVGGSGSAAACAGSPCEFTIEEDSALNVVFTAPGVVVYVGGSGEGSVKSSSPDSAIDCGIECSAKYANGTVVTLEAHPDAGAVFGGWIGCRHTGAMTCEVTIAGESEVTAVFVKNGVVGPPGSTGSQGAKGTQGATGAQGPQGEPGVNGANGTQGAQGPAGPAGTAGPSGPQGKEGPAGPAGKVTCKVTQKGKKARVTCTIKYTGQAKSSSTHRTLRWTLVRQGHVVAHGVGRNTPRIRFGALRHGAYTLYLQGQRQGTVIHVH